MNMDIGTVRFHDRHEAGGVLAERLAADERSEPTLVLGIPRGGVMIADIVAKRLAADFDIVIPRKLGAPYNSELAIGAVTEDGTSYLNTYLINALRISEDYLEKEKGRQVEEIKRRASEYRKPGLPYNIAGKKVILVDDGIATGATIIASARWVRKHNPSRLMIAVPVAPTQSVEVLEQEVDSVLAVHTARDFGSVGQFYQEFAPVSDEEVKDIMRARNLL